MLQHADPFGIALHGDQRTAVRTQNGVAQVVHVGHRAVRVKRAVAVQVEIKPEVVQAGVGVIDEHRRARQQIEVGDVLDEVVAADRAQPRAVVEIVVDVGRAGHTGEKAGAVLVVRRDEQAIVVGIGGGEDVRGDLRLRRRQRGVIGQARNGGVRGGGGGVALAPGDGQERHRHHQRHRQHDERDDQRDAALGVTGDGRGNIEH